MDVCLKYNSGGMDKHILHFFSPYALATIFQNIYDQTEIVRLESCLWFAIFVLSVLGMWKPITFSSVFLVQLICKRLWLVALSIPALKSNKTFPFRVTRKKGNKNLLLSFECLETSLQLKL
jgi:hypothetical protein